MADEGIQTRHQNGCATLNGGTRCNCRRSYRASIYNSAKGRNEYSGYKPSKAEVVKWRVKALGELNAGTRAAGDGPTLREAWAAFYEGAQSGATANERGQRYKSATLRGYERNWRLRVEPALGHVRMGRLRRAEVQAFADKLAAAGDSRSTVNNTLDPLRVLYRSALRREAVQINPTVDIELPGTASEPMRIVTAEAAAAMIAALEPEDRALWACAFYGGLRRGELQALRWDHIDLAAGRIRVQRGWDEKDGEIDLKTRAGLRTVPIVPPLAKLLKAHARLKPRSGSGLVFGRTASERFYPSTVRSRALKAWKDANPPPEPRTLHEARHTCASMMIDAGANAKALSTVMGHAGIEITFNRYGHLMPGGEAEVGQRLADYLHRRNGIGTADKDSSGPERSTADRTSALSPV